MATSWLLTTDILRYMATSYSLATGRTTISRTSLWPATGHFSLTLANGKQKYGDQSFPSITGSSQLSTSPAITFETVNP
jgi:hypothetical protein